MKINSVGRQSFGVIPDKTTKELLIQMETKGQDTQPIAELMNKMYIGNYISTRISDAGNIRMDIYDKKGDQVVKILESKDNMYVDPNTYTLKDAGGLNYVLYSSLLNLSVSRTDKQVVKDKVNSQFHEGI